MPTKRHTAETELLAYVIKLIEAPEPRGHKAACIRLLMEGPLDFGGHHGPELEGMPYEWFSLPRAEILQFLRTLVLRRDSEWLQAEIGTIHRFSFKARTSGDSVRCGVYGETRDVIVLQLVTLIQLIGIPNVMRCARLDCPRIFVKTYRREFCSRRCQNSDYMRSRRGNRKHSRRIKATAKSRR